MIFCYRRTEREAKSNDITSDEVDDEEQLENGDVAQSENLLAILYWRKLVSVYNIFLRPCVNCSLMKSVLNRM